MKGLNEFLNESELSESKREVGKYYNAARKARANNLHLEKTEPDYNDKIGASFTFTGADGDWVEIYYNKKQEKVLMAKNDGIVNPEFHTKGSISIEDMLKLI